MVWKVVKKFQETRKTCNRPGQGRKRTIWTKSERRTYDENGTWIPKKSRVPHAKLSRVHWRMLLKTRVEILNKCCWYLLRILVVLAYPTKFQIRLFFNENYHKMCVAIIMADPVYVLFRNLFKWLIYSIWAILFSINLKILCNTLKYSCSRSLD